MRLATITLPLADNNGRPTNDAHAYLQGGLLAAFDGYTKFPVSGAWRDGLNKVHNDDSMRYEVAFDGDIDILVMLAEDAGRLARQLAVYVVIDGEPRIISL